MTLPEGGSFHLGNKKASWFFVSLCVAREINNKKVKIRNKEVAIFSKKYA